MKLQSWHLWEYTPISSPSWTLPGVNWNDRSSNWKVNWMRIRHGRKGPSTAAQGQEQCTIHECDKRLKKCKKRYVGILTWKLGRSEKGDMYCFRDIKPQYSISLPSSEKRKINEKRRVHIKGKRRFQDINHHTSLSRGKGREEDTSLSGIRNAREKWEYSEGWRRGREGRVGRVGAEQTDDAVMMPTIKVHV